MADEYLKAERLARKSLEKSGSIRWATNQDNEMIESYSKLIDIFSGLGNDFDKTKLLETIARNSGFSDNTFKVGEKDFKAPFTYSPVFIEEEQRYPVAVSLYPLNPRKASSFYDAQNNFFHEGVHFLASYGPENKRIITTTSIDEYLLSDVLGGFYGMMKERSLIREMSKKIGIALKPLSSPKNIPDKFGVKFRRHCTDERIIAHRIAHNAFLIAEKSGEPQGIRYIMDLIHQAALFKSS